MCHRLASPTVFSLTLRKVSQSKSTPKLAKRVLSSSLFRPYVSNSFEQLSKTTSIRSVAAITSLPHPCTQISTHTHSWQLHLRLGLVLQHLTETQQIAVTAKLHDYTTKRFELTHRVESSRSTFTLPAGHSGQQILRTYTQKHRTLKLGLKLVSRSSLVHCCCIPELHPQDFPRSSPIHRQSR